MKSAVAVIVFIVLAWAINGEFAARRLDGAAGIATTECIRSSEQAADASEYIHRMAGHELMYSKIRNWIVKRGAGCQTNLGANVR